MIKRTFILFAIAIIVFSSTACRQLYMTFKGISDEEKAIIQYFIDNSDKLKNGTYDKTKATSHFSYYPIGMEKVFYLEKLSKDKFIYKTDRIAVDDNGAYFHFINIKDVDLEYFVTFKLKYDFYKEKWLLDYILIDDIYNYYRNTKIKSK